MSTRDRVNRIFNIKEDWENKVPQFRKKVSQLYDTGEKEYNPYLDKNGNVFNKYIDYQKVLDNPKVTNTAKKYITQATGLTPTPIQQESGMGYSEYTKSNGVNSSFNASADENTLASLDVATELPKLDTKQISEIISKHFSKSTVIKPTDAEGIYKAQQQTGMSALAILGIGALESGYGTSNIAKQKNNLWGWNATNVNPMGNAKSFSQMSEGATQFANDYMKTYYNGYGAKSISSAGTGNNPAGKGYAYYDNGTINSQWATSIGSIMKNFYQTAKSVAPASAAVSSGGNSLVNTAKQYLGVPYVWGGTSPEGFDCSGLVYYAYAKNGKTIPRTSQAQFASGTAVSKDNLQPGDLVFFKGSQGTMSAPGHVGMYIGNGQYIQAPSTGDVVKVSNLSARSDYAGARRY